MLQYIAKEDDRYTIPELVQMAIEGGCKWIQLHLPDYDDASIRELATEIIPLCKETSTIFTIEGHVELAKELGIHGMLLTDRGIPIEEVREICGPEAIVGIQVAVASEVLPLRKLDIDYVAFTPDMPIERLSENVEALRNEGILLPLVATGAYPISDIPSLMTTGINGIALSDAIAHASDPVAATEEIIRILTTP